MDCPACGKGPVRVKNSRYSKEKDGIVRLRHCKNCGHDWKTIEQDLEKVTKAGQELDVLVNRLIDEMKRSSGNE